MPVVFSAGVDTIFLTRDPAIDLNTYAILQQKQTNDPELSITAQAEAHRLR